MSTRDYKFMKKLAMDDIYNINIYKLFDLDYNDATMTSDGKRNLKRRYRTMIRLYHPDKNPPKRNQGCKDILYMLKNAYLIMTDHELLYKYNKLYNLAKEELEHQELKSQYFSNVHEEGGHSGVRKHKCNNDDPMNRNECDKKTFKDCNREIDHDIQEILGKHVRYINMEKQSLQKNPIQLLVKDELETRQQSKKPLNFVKQMKDGDKNFHRIFEHLQDSTSNTTIIPIEQIQSCNNRHYYKYAETRQVDFKLMTPIDASLHDTINDDVFESVEKKSYLSNDEDSHTNPDDIILEKLKSFSQKSFSQKSFSSSLNPPLTSRGSRGSRVNDQCDKSAMERYKYESHRLANLSLGEFTNDKFSVNI